MGEKMKTFNELRNLSWTDLKKELGNNLNFKKLINQSRNFLLYSFESLKGNRKEVSKNTNQTERLLEQRLCKEQKMFLNKNEPILICQYPTQRGGRSNIDLLGYNKEKKNLVIGELKLKKNTDPLPKVIMQCMDYWCFVKERIKDFKKLLNDELDLELNEEKNPEIYIIAPKGYFQTRRKKNGEFQIAKNTVIGLEQEGIKIKIVYLNEKCLEMEEDSSYFNENE